jgi:hypothetical protein
MQLTPAACFWDNDERLEFNNLPFFDARSIAQDPQETQDPHLRQVAVTPTLRLVKYSFRRCRITGNRGQKGPFRLSTNQVRGSSFISGVTVAKFSDF